MRRNYFVDVATLPPCCGCLRLRLAIGSCSRPDVRRPSSVTATDQELLEALAEEMHEDFAILGITRFAVAYLGTRVTVIRSLDPNSTMQPKTTRVKGVVIELHGVAEPVRLFRQIIKPPSGQPVLAAAVTLDPPVDSPYADVLARPTTASCANDAEAPVH